ncbi:VOC family protein [Oceanibacterium hippocampi]|uniref:Glyoxalase-like domain protein n=1 Tax=Oceanibacterium hippocampi TaxID=745714 RepID=A0A1Y5U642_9PROT|nr:VOC family protein [Oceanibacterium hippocampi]SLN77708.1 Glyoxalase-like domain protein [Oceanibacterium hippocampi]
MGTTIIPTMRYRDAAAMIDWLGRAFGFERHLVVEDGAGGIAHAQLVRGEAMIMLGSARDDAFGRLQQPPADLGGTTQSAYLVVTDPDAVHGTAKAAGAEIVMPLVDNDYGGRGFSARDPEGHLWNFGSYDPWA